MLLSIICPGWLPGVARSGARCRGSARSGDTRGTPSLDYTVILTAPELLEHGKTLIYIRQPVLSPSGQRVRRAKDAPPEANRVLDNLQTFPNITEGTVFRTKESKRATLQQRRSDIVFFPEAAFC